ncbi:sensor histidine kinase KdpD [Prevotella sp. MA2016]|uniref:sensor histidine kinase n=1 Tax=Prevotella sp. MA2016 TaxID=1408310 RepID=UPI0009DF3B59|nr:HAMP domain-containing sensor histidine kinase [Prevotella sp. MA2016]
MKIARILLAFALLLTTTATQAQVDYKKDAKYLELRDSMTHAFNDGDSARFYTHLNNLQNYLLEQNDLHAYYTQRCNDIVFEMNRQKIFEAYSKAMQLSKELREKKLYKEMYMAVNMMGHINRYCGNKEAAKKCFYEVIELMKKNGYYESIPPIYMNIINVAIDDDAQEALDLMDKAKEIAEKYSPDRVFDIETRKILTYYNSGDIDKFMEGYKWYKAGEAKGKSSVHGRSMEAYYLACLGKVDEAVAYAKRELGDEGAEAIPLIYERAGRWKEAYESFKKESLLSDSIDNVVLTNSMRGIQDQLALYETEKQAAKDRTYTMLGAIFMLTLLIVALTYIMISRRKHMKQLRVAYNKAMESEKMKTAFIQNVSHEVRTPLNIITGFAQVISDPDLACSADERKHISTMMQRSTRQVTILIDEILGLSLIESTEKIHKDDTVHVNQTLHTLRDEYQEYVNNDTRIEVASELSDNYAVKTNESMLRRILICLLDNAVKYTEKGTITLRVKQAAEELQLVVEDTGSGVPEAEAERIFDRFVKLDKFKEGIGLGLSLSRKLAEQLGGKIKLDTTYTDGARFIVTLPARGE